ncbi:MAG: serine hydrolase [Anaerolineae bacterium]|nr:serine hydrolase [Anaerolineae bacterium]
MTHVNPLPHSTPEAQGIASAAILKFVNAVESGFDGLHSLILLRHGHVVAEGWWSPYAAECPHDLFSLTKSFTSTAVGFAVSEGRLSVDDLVLSFFPEDAPAEPSPNLAAMRVRHLLTMNTGHGREPSGELMSQPDGNWAKAFLAQPVEFEPGTHFLYNSAASYMLSAIMQQVTGMPILDYLQERLFEPLGIERPVWATCPKGINTGGWGLSLKTGDIARFGQMLLQKGLWNSRRVLPEAWIAEATAYQTSNAPNDNPDWAQGYGYQFWRCRHGIYRGDGAFGQFCIVMPEQDAVLALTAGVGDMQGVLNLVWEHLLPAMEATPLPPDVDAQQALAQTLSTLSMTPARGEPTSPTAARVSGKPFVLDENAQQIETLAFDFDANRVTIRDGRGEHMVACGYGEWIKGTTAFDSTTSRPVAASGAWTDEHTYVIKLCFHETPFCPTLICRFDADRLTFEFKANVAFGPVERPPVKGKFGQN